jgi:hypothetical protein
LICPQTTAWLRIAAETESVVASERVSGIERISLPVCGAMSLETFDEEGTGPTSPRSLEALASLGLHPSSVLFRPLESFFVKPSKGNERSVDAIVPDAAERRFEHHERVRQQHLEAARQRRLQLIEAAENGTGDSVMQSARRKTAHMIQLEEREMQKALHRQTKKLNQVLNQGINQRRLEEKRALQAENHRKVNAEGLDVRWLNAARAARGAEADAACPAIAGERPASAHANGRVSSAPGSREVNCCTSMGFGHRRVAVLQAGSPAQGP